MAPPGSNELPGHPGLRGLRNYFQFLQGTAFAVFTLINKSYSVQIVLQNLSFFLSNNMVFFSGQHVLR